MQTTAHILMVRPAAFGFNEQTAANNAFQTNDKSLENNEISEKAIAEFDAFVAKLRANGVNVYVAQDSLTPHKPDAVFPNNWITMHDDGKMIFYPMFAPLRRLERSEDVVQMIENQFVVNEKTHLEHYENTDKFLEGTGSMILDRPNKICYACLSPRTELSLLNEFCDIVGYKPVAFTATDDKNQEIYHTNVMMALGETFVVICLDTVQNINENAFLRKTFAETDKEIIEISLAQMMRFAGNMLQVRNEKGDTFLVMSQQAFASLEDTQIKQIEKHTNIITADIKTIETYGGGSARCMMAEIFLPKK